MRNRGPRTEELATDATTVEHASPPAKAASGRSWRWFLEKCEPEGGECHTDWKAVANIGVAIAAMCVLFWPRDHMENPNTCNQGTDAATTP